MSDGDQQLRESMQRLSDALNPEAARQRRANEAVRGCGCLVVAIAIMLLFVAMVVMVASLAWRMTS